MPVAIAVTESALSDAQAAFDAGRMLQALSAARCLDTDAAPQTERAEAVRLRAQAAFRLGEFDEAASAAQRLLDEFGGQAPTYPARLRMLTIAALAAAEVARFEPALGHLQKLLSTASRGSLEEFVHARSTAATCFALLGDPWAGQRLLSELMGLFQGLPSESALEAVARRNHTTVCLRIARLARDAGDKAACEEALDHAEVSLQRTREIARLIRDKRLAGFAELQACEAALMRGQAAAVVATLEMALEATAAAGSPARMRYLLVVLAEACLGANDPARALQLLRDADAALHEGHDAGLRIRCLRALQQACEATGATGPALAHAARAHALDEQRRYRQLRTQSHFLRSRLELEHLYRYRTSASRGISSRSGALTAPAALEAGVPARR
jgi:tetratricopeptide (TPR) repeat protein